MGNSATQPAREERYPSTRLCIGYGIGSSGVSIMLNTVSVYFPALMSTVLGVSPVVAGTLLMLSKLYDAFADVAIGTASDATQSRWGRRRPYLLAGAIGSFLSLVMIFLAPPMSGNVLIAYMAVGLVIYSTGYSLFNVPYLALPADITRSNAERLRLISFRTAAIGIGQLIALALSAWLIQRGGGGESGYRMMGIIMATLVLVFMMTSFFGTTKARVNEISTTRHKPSFRDLGQAMGNKPLMLLLGAKLCQYIAFGVMQPINLLFLLNITSLGMTGMIHLAIVQNLMILFSMPAWTRIGVKLGKRNAYLLAQAIMIPSVVSWWWADADLSLPGLWARGMTFGFASAGALLMSTSILPDTIEYDRLRTGRERGGIFASLYSVNEKLGFAIGAAVLGWGMAWGGYVATTGGQIIEQSPSAIHALYLIKTLVPSGMLLVGVFLLTRYKLTEEMLATMRSAQTKD